MLDHSVHLQEKEVNSKSEVGFIPVVSKASKRRARKDAIAAKEGDSLKGAH
jgi:hypothetical protein